MTSIVLRFVVNRFILLILCILVVFVLSSTAFIATPNSFLPSSIPRNERNHRTSKIIRTISQKQPRYDIPSPLLQPKKQFQKSYIILSSSLLEDDDIEYRGGSDDSLDDSDNDDERRQQEKEEYRKVVQRHKYWILLVDDEESIRMSVGDYLYDNGYQVTACSDSDAVVEVLTSDGDEEDSIRLLNLRTEEDETMTIDPSDPIITTTTTNVFGTNDNNNVILNNRDIRNGLASSKNNNSRRRLRVLPDVIVADIRMPGSTMNGIELLQWIRSYNDDIRIRAIPVVLLTAKGLTQDRIIGYQAGATAYLSKPFYPKELLSIIDNAIYRQEQMKYATTTTTVGRMTRNSTATTIGSQAGNVAETTTTTTVPTPMALLEMKDDIETIKEIIRYNTQNVVRQTDVYLTLAERDVLNYIAQGYTNTEIMQARNVTQIGSVTRIIKNLYRKTNVQTRTELIKWAIETGYIPKRI